MEVLVKGDPDAAEAAMREHVMGGMHRALERLEPYFKAHKSQQETYSKDARDRSNLDRRKKIRFAASLYAMEFGFDSR